MMLCLTGDKLPQYYFTDRKVFCIDEKHVNRIADHSTIIIMLSGVLKFSEDGVPVELFPSEYKKQKKDVVRFLQTTSPLQQFTKPFESVNICI